MKGPPLSLLLSRGEEGVHFRRLVTDHYISKCPAIKEAIIRGTNPIFVYNKIERAAQTNPARARIPDDHPATTQDQCFKLRLFSLCINSAQSILHL